jgi:hypothetical protein
MGSYKVGDRVISPSGRAGVVDSVHGPQLRVAFAINEYLFFFAHELTHEVPPSLEEARRLWRAIEAIAEAGHDELYSIGGDTSDLGYAFADERTKRHWREVALAMLRAAGGGQDG